MMSEWYPGFGEVELIRRMSPFVKNFLSAASRENPNFVPDYLLPTLQEYDCEEVILGDIYNALCSIECEAGGLSGHDFEGNWLRNVPSALGAVQVVPKYSTFAKERQAIVAEARRKAQAELAEAKRSKDRERIAREKLEYRQEMAAARKTFQKEKVSAADRKAFTSVYGKAPEGKTWEFFRDTRTGDIVATEAKRHKSGNFFRKAGGAIRKTVRKYGNVLILAAGIALAPFTAGASLAAATLVTSANGLRLKRIAANKAKREGRHAADRMLAEVNQQQAQAGQEMDQFYATHQQWFVDNLGLTPDKWAQLTFDQKVDLLQHGMNGTVPGTPVPGGGSGSAGGGYGTSGGGGGEAGGAGGAPGSGQQIATASMFDGPMLPLLAGGLALALFFGKPVKGRGRRTRRNPSRRHRSRWSRRTA